MHLGGRFAVGSLRPTPPHDASLHRSLRCLADLLVPGGEPSRLQRSRRQRPLVNSREIDPQALFDYVYFHMIPAPRTIYRGVQRLAPCNAIADSMATAVVLESTWQPQFASHRNGSVGELAALFRGLIRQSVEFEAAHPSVGCFLSGGTDSSTVAGTLKQIDRAGARRFRLALISADTTKCITRGLLHGISEQTIASIT